MENIFKWFTEEGGSPKANVYVYWFVRQFSPKNFNGIDRLLMCFLCYCAKLSIVPCRKWLEAYLKVDGKQDIKQHNIKVETNIQPNLNNQTNQVKPHINPSPITNKNNPNLPNKNINAPIKNLNQTDKQNPIQKPTTPNKITVILSSLR